MNQKLKEQSELKMRDYEKELMEVRGKNGTGENGYGLMN